jgi:hypothetical protein
VARPTAGSESGASGAELAAQLVEEVRVGGRHVGGEAQHEHPEQRGGPGQAAPAGLRGQPQQGEHQRRGQPGVAADPPGRAEQQGRVQRHVLAGAQPAGERERGGQQQQAGQRLGQRRALHPHGDRRQRVEQRGQQRPRPPRPQSASEGPQRQHREQRLQMQQGPHVVGADDHAGGGEQGRVQVQELGHDLAAAP